MSFAAWWAQLAARLIRFMMYFISASARAVRRSAAPVRPAAAAALACRPVNTSCTSVLYWDASKSEGAERADCGYATLWDTSSRAESMMKTGRKGGSRTGGFGRDARGAFGRKARIWANLALILPIASCVPAIAGSGPTLDLNPAEAPVIASTTPSAAPPQASAATGVLPTFDIGAAGGSLQGATAFTANANLPIAGLPSPAAAAYAFRPTTPVDQMRSLDCLTQAIYYEAGNQSEDGQRAVAQVVLNRVRHPAWPNTVCGVVYQGAMRAGGGCQFTFTCDGSLARTPVPTLWTRARQFAAEALAGRSYAPVGLSTFYHANYVFPGWAPRLVKTAQIGAHIFYRLPGLAGAPGSFSNAYTGNEPVVRGSSYMARRGAGLAPSFAETPAFNPAPDGYQAPVRTAAPVPSDIPQDSRWTPNNLPQSGIREEHQQSGQWRTDAPGSVAGAR
jgi:spore germination cell wall hydrolase CwlJ-like protein